MKRVFAACVAASLALPAQHARAGVYADDLGKCLVSSTSDADKALLVKWIFSAIALQKDIAPYTRMPAEVRTDINKQTAGLYMRLLTETCRSQTATAFKYEGQAAIASAFQLLGQVASQGIFSDPSVEAGMGELTQYFDADKLSQVLDAGK